MLMGLRLKIARIEPQMYIQRDVDIVLPDLLIYMGFRHF